MTDTNIWSPSGDELNTWTPEPYEDDPDAAPMSQQPGRPDSGTVPDARANLLSDVRDRMATPPPVQEVHHYVENIEQAPQLIRARTFAITGTITPVTILDANPRRKRAIIQVMDITAAIVLTGLNDGGRPGYLAAPIATPSAGFVVFGSTGTFEIKSQAGVAAYAVVAAETSQVFVGVWEELYGAGNVPGLT